MSRRRPLISLDVWETALILALLAVGATMLAAASIKAGRPMFTYQSDRERAFFEDTYGPGRNSEREEEWLIRDFFQGRRDGVFLDVGANDYKFTSKTYYLETELGWRGVAIEPQQEFAADYAAHRPKTKFLSFFVSDASNETARLYTSQRTSLVASGDQKFVQQFGPEGVVREVPTITLNDLLQAEGITKIDFMSMDIELHEPQALRGFDIDRFRPSLVCIEGLLPVRQQILEYFTRHGYVLIGKYLWVDRENLYFTPVPAESEPVTPAPVH
jgi:FkbM family methyltransferase